MMFNPPSLADYTNQNYNQDGTMRFVPNPSTNDKNQQTYLDELDRKKQQFDSQYGTSSGGGGGGGSTLHQIGTALATSALSGALGGSAGAGAGGALSGLLAAI